MPNERIKLNDSGVLTNFFFGGDHNNEIILKRQYYRTLGFYRNFI